MAIERKIFEYYDTWANNVAEVVDWIGTLPSGLIMDSTGVTITLPNGKQINEGVSADNYYTPYRYGYKTSNGILLTTVNAYAVMIITPTNKGSTAIVFRLSGTGSPTNRNTLYHAIDLTYSTQDYNNIGNSFWCPKASDITAFLPVVCGGGTYTPKLFACCGRQYTEYGTMLAGGKQYAYDGFMALED